MKKWILWVLIPAIMGPVQLWSQCTTPISTFPYQEGFEGGPSNWFSGGINDDWAWGTPNKSLIQTAGGGTKCWVVGGLTGSFYSYGQRSYVQSPCFDFTTIVYPWVSFKIWWETENIYDGATFQYSINNGATWVNVGTNTDPVNCLNENWFNQGNITALTNLANPKHGWAGTTLPTSGSCTGGGGSGGWVTAKHCIAAIAGQPQVIFRFAFGAGTICNNYDGFAFDDVYIGEAPPNQTDFSFTCTGNPLEYQFTPLGTLCPDTYTWNFGDPASGASNTSSASNPVHQFSAPGTYTVSLSESGPCNGNGGAIKILVTIGSSQTITPVSCYNGNTGGIQVTATNASGIVNYTLQPNNTSNNTGVFNNLTPGNYTTTVTDANGCSVTSLVNIPNPAQVQFAQFNVTPITCYGLQNASLQVSGGGGTGSYSYTLQPLMQVNSTGNFQGLGPGTYTVTAADGNLCSTSSVLAISAPSPVVITNFQKQNIQCFGQTNGSLSIQGGGGTGVFNYLLQPGNTINSTGQFSGLNSGSYTVVVSDGNNCSYVTAFSISEPAPLIIQQLSVTQPQCNPNNSGVINVTASGGTGTITFSAGGVFATSNSFGNLPSGTYTITVKDANGCTQSSVTTLTSPNAPVVTAVQYTPIPCAGEISGSITISASGIAPITNYIIQPGAIAQNSSVFPGQTAGTYTIQVTDANSCTGTSIFQIGEPDPVLIQSTQFEADSCGDSYAGKIRCSASGGTGGLLYRLEPLNAQNSSGIFNIPTGGVYTITAIDVNGCSQSSSLAVENKICCEKVFLPNAFSPNGDGKNDEFRMLNTFGITLEYFAVFNRWGNEVFRTENSEFGWNGRQKGEDAEPGTYFYVVRYTCSGNSQKYVLKGDLILLR